MDLTNDLFTLFGEGISGRDLVLLGGGLFLLYKASHEIFVEVEAREEVGPEAQARLKAARTVFWAIIGQIAIIDIVFSLDSVITAVGMVDELPVMVAAVVAAVGVMLFAARPVGDFVQTPSLGEGAGAGLPGDGGHGAHRRSLRLPRAQGLHLRVDGVLARGGDAEHPGEGETPRVARGEGRGFGFALTPSLTVSRATPASATRPAASGAVSASRTAGRGSRDSRAS